MGCITELDKLLKVCNCNLLMSQDVRSERVSVIHEASLGSLGLILWLQEGRSRF
jgi:hypothetical protein